MYKDQETLMVRFTARSDELPYYMIQFKGSEQIFEIVSSHDEVFPNSTYGTTAWYTSPWKHVIDQFDLAHEAVKKNIHFINRNYKINANGETSSFLRI